MRRATDSDLPEAGPPYKMSWIAVFGRDANWGRVAMAIGKSGCELDPTAFDITFAGIAVCRAGHQQQGVGGGQGVRVAQRRLSAAHKGGVQRIAQRGPGQCCMHLRG